MSPLTKNRISDHHIDSRVPPSQHSLYIRHHPAPDTCDRPRPRPSPILHRALDPRFLDDLSSGSLAVRPLTVAAVRLQRSWRPPASRTGQSALRQSPLEQMRPAYPPHSTISRDRHHHDSPGHHRQIRPSVSLRCPRQLLHLHPYLERQDNDRNLPLSPTDPGLISTPRIWIARVVVWLFRPSASIPGRHYLPSLSRLCF